MKDIYSIYYMTLAFAMLTMEALPTVFLLTKEPLPAALLQRPLQSFMAPHGLMGFMEFLCIIFCRLLYDVLAFSYFLVLYISILQ